MATTVETIASFLTEVGAARLFGVPAGGATLDLIEAARQHRMPFVAAAHEASAAIMAAASGDWLGKPGVCLIGRGAGSASACAGLAHSAFDRVPLLLLTDRPGRRSAQLSPAQAADQLRWLDPWVKAGATISAPRVGRLLAWAWAKAQDVPPGPVHLDLPADETGRAVPRAAPAPREPRQGADPSPHAIRSIGRLLGRCGRVVVIAGLECRGARVARALQDLVEHLGSPLLTTPRAKGVVADDHPLVAGTFIGGRLDEELLAKADGVLAVGLDPVELLSRPWRTDLPVAVLGGAWTGPRPFEAACEAAGEITAGLEALRGALPPGGGWRLADWAARAAGFRAEVRARLAEAGMGRSKSGVPPHRVVEIARAACPREAIATVDTGAHAPVVAAFWDSFHPKGFVCSSGLGLTGFALPAAIGVKLAAPERPVLAFVGDAGFLRSLGDLAHAAWQRTPIVGIVFLDGSASASRVLQEQRRFAPVGTTLGNLDVARLTEGFGGFGTEVEDEPGLQAALKDALAAAQPAVIGVRVRSTGYRRMLELVHGKGRE
jgi:acetolactate synthase-1/2/3 large subunit